MGGVGGKQTNARTRMGGNLWDLVIWVASRKGIRVRAKVGCLGLRGLGVREGDRGA